MANKELKPWKTLSSEPLIDARWLKIFKEECELPNGKIIDDFYTIWQPDWVLILPLTKNGNWVMTRQYRHGTRKISLEFPAGIIEKGEEPLAAARRELEEETECLGGEYEFVGDFSVNPDRHKGRFYVYLARGVAFGGTAKQDDTEDIVHFEVSPEELEEKIRTGEMNHPLQIAAYFKMKLGK